MLHQNIKISVTCKTSGTPREYNCHKAINSSSALHTRVNVNAPNNWMSVSFKSHMFVLTHYSFQSNERTHFGWPPPRNWTLFASDGISSYEMIDDVIDAPINEDFVVYSRNISSSKKYSDFQFVMNGVNYGGSYDFRMHKIDFFGAIFF